MHTGRFFRHLAGGEDIPERDRETMCALVGAGAWARHEEGPRHGDEEADVRGAAAWDS